MKVAAFVLAGGRAMEMGVLTLRRAKSAMPFAGSYRMIDFAMSNLARSGVERVGVLSQYRPSSLMDHVGQGEPWGLVGRCREVKLMPPYQAEKRVDWYKGTADAVYQNLRFLKDEDNVLIVSGDHVYSLDYTEVFRVHEETAADLTMVFKRFPDKDCSRFGVATVDDKMRVTSYEEKPRHPRGNLASLTIFLFRRDVLEAKLRETMAREQPEYQLYKDIIPSIVASGKAQAVVHDGYWAYSRTVDDYFAASMDLLKNDSCFNIDSWDIQTNVESSGIGDKPPAFVGPSARVDDSRLSAGCEVRGTVIRSVLSPGVVVEEGAVVTDSVLLHNVLVGRNATLNRVIADKRVRIGARSAVGHCGEARPNERAAAFHTCGVTALGRESAIEANAIVGSNVQVAPYAVVAAGIEIPDGALLES